MIGEIGGQAEEDAAGQSDVSSHLSLQLTSKRYMYF